MTTDSTVDRRTSTARRRARAGITALTLLGLACAGAVAARGETVAVHPSRRLAFEANRGPLGAEVHFRARGAGYTVLLDADEAILALHESATRSAMVRVKPVGAAAARIVPEDELPGVVNVATRLPGIGSIAAPTYARVRYVGIYRGVDLAYYGGPRGLEYDFIVAPGADPTPIALAFDGVERLDVDAAGDLVLHTAAGELRQPRPIVYQDVDGNRRRVAGDYVVDAEGRVGFRLGAYDTSRPLVIDPELAYSTYLGGLGDESDIFGSGTVAVGLDAAGNAYVAGTTSSTDFPTTAGAAGGANAGGLDVFVTKLSPDGEVLYSTYLGGPCDDVARDIAVDAAGNAYVTGRVHGGVCWAEVQAGVLVAKLDPTGALVYGSVIGGTLADSSIGKSISVDTAGHAYVTGIAATASFDFPTTPGALRTQACGGFGSDGFVAKVSADGAALEYSTFLCGGGDDSPSSIGVDADGNAYVGGTTGSSDFPTVNPIQATRLGGPVQVTGFVSKVAPDASHLVWSTYLGGTGNDYLEDLAVDVHGDVYVTGQTDSEDFPTTPGVVQEHAGNRFCLEICSDAFVTKIDTAGTGLQYSTYLYGELDDAGTAITVDDDQHAFVVGTTVSAYFPHEGAFQATNHGLADAFVAKLSRGGTRLLYSSYLGGAKAGASPSTGWDVGSGIAIDAAGTAWVTGYTQSYDFPTTPNAFQPSIAPGTCDYFGGPCGDAFVTHVTADGRGVEPPISLIVAEYEYVAGRNNMKTTWAGLPAPSPDDYLALVPLGDVSGALGTVVAWWHTNGAAGGQMPIPLPGGIAPGEYEMRLVSTDPGNYGLFSVVARSEPIHIVDSVETSTTVEPASTTTSTTIPSVSQCEVEGPTACQTGNPCTVDQCVPGVGCVSTPLDGFDAVTCACERAVPDACAGRPLPASIVRGHDRSCGLLFDASGSKKRVKKAVKGLKGALAAVARARKTGKLSPDCAGALGAELGEAKDRAERFLATFGTR